MNYQTSRRQFLAGASGAIALATSLVRADETVAQSSNKSIIKPAVLKKGDKVGMVAPASYSFEPEDIKIAKEVIEQYGFEVELGAHIASQYGYLAGKDVERASDINKMFRRPDIRGIFTFSGGYGSSRLLHLLDYELIRQNPKVIIGHSDITALVLAIHQKTGLITFHGSSGLSNVGNYAIAHFRRAVMATQNIGEIAKSPYSGTDDEARKHRLVTIVSGQANSQLVGGNLSLVVNLLGTPYEIDTKDKILFLEDIGEEPYRIDRMLTQLFLAGKLQAASGFALGHFVDCQAKDGGLRSFSLEEVLRDRFEPLGKPTLYNLMFGHITENAVLPLGVNATLDATAKKLVINESAVNHYDQRSPNF
ncbi:MAG: LD-carboxypeptidase [Pseudanabaena sp.]